MAIISMDYGSVGGKECEFYFYDQQKKPISSNGQITDIGFEPDYISITSFTYGSGKGIRIVYDKSVSTTQYTMYYTSTVTRTIGDSSSAGFTYIGADKVVINPTYASNWGNVVIVAYKHVKE